MKNFDAKGAKVREATPRRWWARLRICGFAHFLARLNARHPTRIVGWRCVGPEIRVLRQDSRHLMLQPMEARWLGSGRLPAMTASRAERRSRPVTGVSLPESPRRGRESSSWPR